MKKYGPIGPPPREDFFAKSSMFMRVRRTVPHFTFSFSQSFVNGIPSVSTGFFRVFPVLSGISHNYHQKCPSNSTFVTQAASLFAQPNHSTPIQTIAFFA
jgi:hypothetical protein